MGEPCFTMDLGTILIVRPTYIDDILVNKAMVLYETTPLVNKLMSRSRCGIGPCGLQNPRTPISWLIIHRPWSRFFLYEDLEPTTV